MTHDPANPPAPESAVGGIFDVAEDVRAVCESARNLIGRLDSLVTDARANGVRAQVTWGGVTIHISLWVNED